MISLGIPLKLLGIFIHELKKTKASPGRWIFESQVDPQMNLDGSKSHVATEDVWQLSVSLSDDCGFCEGFCSATPSEHLKNHDTGGLEPWNFMNFPSDWEFHHH